MGEPRKIILAEKRQHPDYPQPDCWESPNVLAIPAARGGYGHGRYGIGYVGPEGTARRVDGGPVLPGPYAYLYGLSWAMTANPEHSTAAEKARNIKAGLEWDAHAGDQLVIGGYLWRLDVPTRSWLDPELVLLHGPLLEDFRLVTYDVVIERELRWMVTMTGRDDMTSEQLKTEAVFLIDEHDPAALPVHEDTAMVDVSVVGE